MPENETALEPVLDAPPPEQIHQYMTPSVGQSVTILDPDVQGVIDEFKRERLELDADETDTPASNLPAKVETAVSALAEQLGGIAAGEKLAAVLNDPNADLTQILPAEQIESLVWSALDNVQIQATVLSDPDVQLAIERELFYGHKIEDIRNLLSQYQPADGRTPDEVQAKYIEAENRVATFQRNFFTSDIDATVKSFGLDESNPEPITDALLLARTKFIDANHQQFIHIQGLHERGLGSQAVVPEARLQNKWMGTLLKELQKLKSQPKARSKVNTKDATEKDDQPAKPIDVTDGHGGWVRDFVIDFKQERQRRGLLTAEEKRQQGKH